VIPLTSRANVAKIGKALLSRTRDSSSRSVERPNDGTYVVRVRDTSSRRQAFAAFVRKSLADARATRGWNGTTVAAKTGLSRQTINRWVRADWVTDPEPARVVAFCEGLGINPTLAFGILGWDRSATGRPNPEPPPMDPDVAALLHKLLDPRVSEAEKYHIRETVRYLAYRPAIPDEGTQRKRQTG
jgi:transcriptional regulator with XRE-family HTH domain